MLIHLVAGARPNYMKVFPIWKALRELQPEWRVRLIHTGQHYDPVMSDVFFEELGLPSPDFYLGVGSGSHAVQTAKVMLELDALFNREQPDLLIVVGDVNSTLAATLVAVKRGIRVAHVEAGLRSGDRSMPEEVNRIMTDAVADILFTSCADGERNLLAEGVPSERIHFVGNVMIDSLVQMLPLTHNRDILSRLGVSPGEYIVVTLHRPTNVDDASALQKALSVLGALSEELPILFPVHPRTRKIIEKHGLPSLFPGVKLLEPLGYLDFLRLESAAALVITDSGGVQEETSFLRIRCLTLRPNTERPVTIAEGTNSLTTLNGLLCDAQTALASPQACRSSIALWDGLAATRIVEHISNLYGG